MGGRPRGGNGEVPLPRGSDDRFGSAATQRRVVSEMKRSAVTMTKMTTAAASIFTQPTRLAVFCSIRRNSSVGSFVGGLGDDWVHSRELLISRATRSIRDSHLFQDSLLPTHGELGPVCVSPSTAGATTPSGERLPPGLQRATGPPRGGPKTRGQTRRILGRGAFSR
jgi:hypothetical protein